MKRFFALLCGLMFCFVFTTVNSIASTQNKDVGITCVNQVFTPETFNTTIPFEKQSDVQQIYAGGYDTGIGLLNSKSYIYTQNLASNEQYFIRVHRHGIGKTNNLYSVSSSNLLCENNNLNAVFWRSSNSNS
jgi:hypothetical protein